jgi:hypothetical protein
LLLISFHSEKKFSLENFSVIRNFFFQKIFEFQLQNDGIYHQFDDERSGSGHDGNGRSGSGYDGSGRGGSGGGRDGGRRYENRESCYESEAGTGETAADAAAAATGGTAAEGMKIVNLAMKAMR